MSIYYTKKYIKKVIYFSILLSVALILSYVETLFSLEFYGIGIKIGLSNIVIIISIFMLSNISSFLIGIFKVLILSFMFSNMIYFYLSLSGFLLSFLIMIVLIYLTKLKNTKVNKAFNIKIILISILGSISHNIAQIVCCYFILNRTNIIFNLLYILIPISIITGIIVGYLSLIVLKKINYIRGI